MTALITENSTLLVLLLVWVLPWKGVALWRAAMREDKWWFIALFIINTFAVLDIYYIFFVAKPESGVDDDLSGDELAIDEVQEAVEDGNESEATDTEEELEEEGEKKN